MDLNTPENLLYGDDKSSAEDNQFIARIVKQQNDKRLLYFEPRAFLTTKN